MEESMDKRIVVVGAGALGGYTGGNLAHNGFDVTLVDPWPEHIEAIRRNGLSLEGVTPEESVVVHPKTLPGSSAGAARSARSPRSSRPSFTRRARSAVPAPRTRRGTKSTGSARCMAG
jgi:glycine/D-amino acid oxidase-like deaminating enzyme